MAAATSQPGKLEFSLSRIWDGQERATRFAGGGSKYQLDHVLASPEVEARIASDAAIDPAQSSGRYGSAENAAYFAGDLGILGCRDNDAVHRCAGGGDVGILGCLICNVIERDTEVAEPTSSCGP